MKYSKYYLSNGNLLDTTISLISKSFIKTGGININIYEIHILQFQCH